MNHPLTVSYYLKKLFIEQFLQKNIIVIKIFVKFQVKSIDLSQLFFGDAFFLLHAKNSMNFLLICFICYQKHVANVC